MIENTNTLSQKDTIEVIMELGASNAKLDAIAYIVRYIECKTDAIEAIKCVLGMFDEKEEKE
jgi:hypothetical protein